MLENEITELLIKRTLAGDPALTASFLHEVCGVIRPEGHFDTEVEVQLREARPARGVVVGIAPLPGLQTGDQRRLGSRPDAMIADSEVIVLLEFKRTGAIEHQQMVRHALEWAFDIPREVPVWGDDPPPGFTLATWGTVAGWTQRCLSDPALAPSRDRLVRLASVIEAEGLARLNGRHPVSAEASLASVLPDPEPIALREVTAGYDIQALRQRCETLFDGPLRIQGGDSLECERDAVQLRSAYAQAGEPIPEHLAEHDPMTPYRHLTIMYTGEDIRDAYPKSWTLFTGRVIQGGADQAVLLAMLAWACRARPGARPKNVQNNIARLWDRTPKWRPGLADLHRAVDASRVG